MIPLSLLVLMLLAFGFHVAFWVLGVAATIVPVGLIVSSVLVAKRLPRFEMSFNRHMQRGDAGAMRELYRGATFLRLMAPADRMLAKKGMIRLQEGDVRSAEELLEDAYDMAPRSRKAELLGPLARVKYQMERFDELGEIAEQWRQRSLFTGPANVYLAAACLKELPPDRARARELIEEAEGALGKADSALATALLAQAE